MNCISKAVWLLRVRGLLLLLLLRDGLDQLMMTLKDAGKLLKDLFTRHG